MNIITDYKNRTDLKSKIIDRYIAEINSEIESRNRCLSNQQWSSSGSDYHKECRIDIANEIVLLKKQLNVLM